MQSNVMEPRRKALASRSVDIDEETFEIAVTEYKDLSHTRDYIDRGEFLSYSDAYKYQLRSLHFVPKQQVLNAFDLPHFSGIFPVSLTRSLF